MKWNWNPFSRSGHLTLPPELENTDIIDENSLVSDWEQELNSLVDGEEKALTRAYRSAARIKRDNREEVSGVRDHYMMNAVIALFLADVKQKRDNRDPLLMFASKRDDIQTKLDEFAEGTDWEQLITDIVPDLMAYGEYHTRLSEDGTVEDDVKQHEIITSYRHGEVHQHYKMKKQDPGSMKRAVLEEYGPSSYAHFSINNNRVRVDIDGKDDKEQKLPANIRVGGSYFYPIIDKLKSIRDSEAVLDAAQINALTNTTVIGVDVPGTTSPADAMRITQRYQKMLNASKAVLAQDGSLTVAKVMSALGNIKVLPIYGGDSNKGSLNKLDVKQDNDTSGILENIRDKRSSALGTLGVPPGLIFAGLDDDAKSSTLKRYSRYAKSLTIIEQGITQGIAQLAMAYVANGSSIDFDKKDIEVSFYYQPPALELLDHLEIVATSLDSLQSLDEYLVKISEDEQLAGMITPEIRREVVGKQLSLMLGRDLLSQEDPAEPMDGDEPVPDDAATPEPLGSEVPPGEEEPEPSPEESDDDIEISSEEIDAMFPEITRIGGDDA